MSRRDHSEHSQSSYIKRFSLIAGSALEEAECFVTSLKALQSSLDQSNSPSILEKDLKGTMDQYVRLTMVCDVLKVFNPFKSPSPSPVPQLHASTSPLVKVEADEVKPSHLLQASPPPPPQNTAVRKETGHTSSIPASPSQTQVTTAVNQKPVVSQSAQVRQYIQQVKHNSIISDIQTMASNNNTNTTRSNPPPPSSSSSSMSRGMPNFGTNSNRSELKARPLSNNADKKEGISTTKFIETFEAILTYFASSNKLPVDDTWEKLFIHSLPSQHKDWFTTELQGKYYTWERAKSIFYQEFGRNEIGSNNKPFGVEKIDKNLARKTRYAEALLNLEMQENDDLSLFNEKFKRYSDQAGMTCDGSLLKRYVNSLTERYREMALPLLNHPDYANNLSELMKHVERLVQPGLMEVDAPCSHNWNKGSTFRSTWLNKPQKRRVDHNFEGIEKRQRSQPVPQY